MPAHHDVVHVVCLDVVDDGLCRIPRLDDGLDLAVGLSGPIDGGFDQRLGTFAGGGLAVVVRVEQQSLAHPGVDRRDHVQDCDLAVKDRQRVGQGLVGQRRAVQRDQHVRGAHSGFSPG